MWQYIFPLTMSNPLTNYVVIHIQVICWCYHIKNVQHKEQITPANIFYIMIPSLRVGDYIVLHIQDVAVYISLKNDDRTRLSPAYFVFG